MRTRARTPAVRCTLAALLLIATGCTAGPVTPPAPSAAPPVQLDGWRRVPLPKAMHASSIALIGRTLVVGGYVGTGTDRAPALARGAAADPHFAAADVAPQTPYGKVADLVSVTGSGSSVVALGAAHGGAHSNFRWTVWSGSTGRVIDRPQSFYAFGGEEAGGLLDVAWDGSGPMIVGTWQGARGLDGRIWRVAHDRWSRQAPVPALTNTATRQVAPRAAETRSGATMISGSVIDLADGVHQSAAIWRGSGASWTLTVLPDAGRRSEAWSTDCAASCATLGSRDGVAALWDDGSRAPLPELTVGDGDNGVVLNGGDRVLAALSSSGSGRLLVGHAGEWRAYTAPDGVVRAALLVGSRLYLVTEDGGGSLWSRDVSDLLAR